MIVTNASDLPVAFRDDAGKHVLEPGKSTRVVGAQHRPMVLAVPGVVEGRLKPRKVKAEDA